MGCGLEPIGVQALAAAFKTTPHLTKLNMMGSKVDQEAADALTSEAFPNLGKLEELDMSYSHIEAGPMKALAPGLRFLLQLRALNLRNNDFEAEGLEAFAKEAMPSLKKLK